jgi:malate dehydrogenase (oxaloacetate-decarboxylating)
VPALPNASYSITMRLHLDPDDARAVGRVTTAIGDADGVVVAMDFVETVDDVLTVDVTANAWDGDHAENIRQAVDALEGIEVHRSSDRTFLLHLKGKLEVRSTVPLKTRDDLSMAYTPGVARVCLAIAKDPEDARSLTIKGNTVAIVSDGSAVLGLGDIGPEAAMPVMEGKAVLFKRFAGIDAWPVCINASTADEIVALVEAIAPAYGGINLEDIAAPKCFEVEERLKASLQIPVFHDDQHGTAIVVLAALYNALRVVGKELQDVTVAMSGAGAAGMAIAKLLLREGVGDIIAADRQGILDDEHQTLDGSQGWLAVNTNHQHRTGTLRDAVRDADVFIGVSAPGVLDPVDIATMAQDPIVFALANPDPEVDPTGAGEYAAVVATGRSDYPNQINNVLAFPGVFRGALDARARFITEKMKAAAARALADVISPEHLRANYIIPSPFDERVASAVAAAVRDEAKRSAAAPTD